MDSTKITWISSNSNIASVDEDGTVKFTGNEGTVIITVLYEYADGKSVNDEVAFSVTKNQYVVPSDGTDDFPEYPNQGSIRYDKTATAVGNFSETGIANVELSMTGVPYGTSTKTDVVVMVDMTASMSDDDVTAAELAVQELIESLVYDEENDKYDSNIQLFVDTFSSGSSDTAVTITNYHDCTTISSAAELTTAKNAISFSQSSQGGGTRYNIVLADVYETLNRDGHAENQFVVFVSDGVATAYSPLTDGAKGTTITGQNSETSSLCAGWFDDSGEVTTDFETEYYTYMIKTAGIPVYTVGANLTTLSDAADLLNHMSSNYSPDGKTSTGETKYSFFCTTSGGITDEVLEIFHGIGQDIKEAATNVVVEDKIADKYTMNFALPSGVTADEAGMDDFYIQVVGYELDENNERKDTPTVIEKFLFNSEGTITHTIGSITCGDTCTHVTKTDGVVTAIDGTYFDYSSTSDGEFITWKADKLDRTELALQYFVYLDNSAGDVAAADQVEAGTYDTNEYATLTYTNFKGVECQQYFPIPSLTWMGAQVTYVFYLVNDDGQPVNRAGKVIPFAEAVYVTDPVTYDVTWNENDGTENMLAENLFAISNVPDVYELYDEQAYYEIRVYQTEGVDNNVVNYNYFIINGADSGLTSKETTKVYNTKAGTKFDDYGIYSAQNVGTVLNTTDEEGNATTVTTTEKTTDIDYANTTVAFAVVWKPELVPDTVVIDYGLDVIIDVSTNDALASGVVGLREEAPVGVTINSGTYSTTGNTSSSISSSDNLWTANVESLTSVRFHMNKMGISDVEKFYYEADVNYYTYDNNTATLNTDRMYSSVTVVPATIIYYEDTENFVTYTNSTGVSDDAETGTPGKWSIEGTEKTTATQASDRPGESKISADLDADNIYGYDGAYENCTTYSLGSAHKVTVSSELNVKQDDGTYPNNWPTASFTFTGTAFDIISQTSNTTGTITVKVVGAETGYSKQWIVDTYHGYTCEKDATNPYIKYTFTYGSDSKWHMTAEEIVANKDLMEGEKTEKPLTPAVGDTFVVFEDNLIWTATNDTENTLYQIPVIKSPELTYDTYTVTITPRYADSFNHTNNESSYDFYMDAVRIYNPAENSDAANEIYEQDGEAYPEFIEIRNSLIGQDAFADTSSNVAGAVFIDGFGTLGTVSDYSEFGPNNEVYLQKGQSIAFKLTSDAFESFKNAHLGMKAPNGGNGKVTVGVLDATDANGDFTIGTSTTVSTSSASELYYDVTKCVKWDSGESKIIVITNENDVLVSLTNLKLTYEPVTTTATSLSISLEEAETVATVMSLRYVASLPEEEVEELEPIVFEPETFEVKVNKTNVKAGNKVKVTITTSTDVERVTVNGEEVTQSKVNRKKGIISWSYTLQPTEEGKVVITVIAYNEDGIASEPVDNTITVQDSKRNQNNKKNK